MKKILIILLLLVGCGTPGFIRADAIEGTVKRLVDRHDVYVEADPSLSDLQKRVNKRDGELLLLLLEESQKPTTEDDGLGVEKCPHGCERLWKQGYRMGNPNWNDKESF